MVAAESRIIDVIRDTVNQQTGNSSKIQYTPGVIEGTAGAYLTSAYMLGNELLEEIVVPAGLSVSTGAYAIIGVMDGEKSWVERVLPSADYSKFVVDPNVGSISMGDGNSPPIDYGSAGQSLYSAGTGQSTYWGRAFKRFAADYGDTAAVSFPITHNLNTLDVVVSVYRVSDGLEVAVDIVRTGVDTLTIQHAIAPDTNEYRVVVVG